MSVTGDAAETAWLPAPQRHEGGTPNVLGIAALAAACRAPDPLIDDTVPAHEREPAGRLREGLATVPGLRTLSFLGDAPDRTATVSCTLGDLPAGLVAAALSAEHGIGVRDGRFCAHPLLERLTGGTDAVRVSLGLRSTADDVDRLVAGLTALTRRGPAWTYGIVDGRWTPTPDPRPPDPFALGDRPGLPGCDR